MNILITGGTGFIGRVVVRALLERGDSVIVLTRDIASPGVPDGARAAAWDPNKAGDWAKEIDGTDAVIHLTGERVVGKRWNQSVKDRILLSRTVSTGLIVQAIADAKKKPGVFLCASGVGYYGQRDATPVDESGDAGEDFLALVCRGWEAAARGADQHGARSVQLRTGIVFGRGGGALDEMVKPFKMFAGGAIGTGRQMVSWIHMADLVAIFLRALDDEKIRGPVNVTSPNPVSNAELAKTIGKVLGRPSFVRVPELALRARFGEGADPLLTGQSALPGVLTDAGFEWRFPELRPALEDLLG